MATKWIWKKWFVALWAVNVTTMAALTFFLQPWQWAAVAAVALGGQEGFALWHGAKHFPNKSDRFRAPYPPLTYATRYYLPRWLTYAVYGSGTGAAGLWVTTGLPPVVRAGIVAGFYAWLIEHFELTYREIPEPKKNAFKERLQ